MIKKEDGYTLLLVMLIIVVVSVLGITLMTASSNTSNTIVNERTDQSTYYIAEAGINLEKAKIIEIISELYDQARQHFNALDPKRQQQLISIYGSFDHYYNWTIAGQYCASYNAITNTTICKHNSASTLFEYTNSYQLSEQFQKLPISDTKVTLNCHTLPCQFELSATGFFSDNPTKARTLKQQLKVDSTVVPESNPDGGSNGGGNNHIPPSKPLENMSALTTGTISLTGGASIEGSASTHGLVSMSGGTSISGTIHALAIDVPDYMNHFKQQLDKPISMDLLSLLPPFPTDKFNSLASIPYMQNAKVGNHNIIQGGNFDATNYQAKHYELTLQPQTRFKTFEVGIDQTIYLNIGNQNVDLYVNDFDISRGHLKIIGSGTLNIYINNTFELHGSIHRDGNPNNVNIYYTGKNKLDFSGDANISGTIYAHTANLNITGGAKITGNIYTGGTEVDISGGISTKGQYLVAPNAHLNLTGGGTIYGTVIAKSIEGSGGTKIVYGQPVVPLPTLPTLPIITIDDKNKYLIESSLLED